MSNNDKGQGAGLDCGLQFANSILDRSVQHVAAIDNRINYVLAVHTALLVLVGRGINYDCTLRASHMRILDMYHVR
jgi:hypothetical protein